ncbi:MAG TPA: ATP-binding protein [Vicinamibacterales bacterium]|nr:ATP-binding protein [Vicinamibacterales bacterium]
MTIKARQVLGVTVLVGLVVAVLSAVHLATLARLSLQETDSRGDLLANAIFQRAREVVPGTSDPYDALRKDPGLRSILASSIAYSKNVTYAAVVDTNGVAVAHSFQSLEGRPLPDQGNLHDLQGASILAMLRAVYSDRIYEVRQRLLFGDRDFGSTRIGVSTLLVRSELQGALWQATQTALGLMLLAMLVATLLSQWLLRPIHVIRAGLSRLGRGEANVRLELPEGEEFKELGSSFEQVSAQLAAMRARQLGQPSEVETVVERLEDAVALVNASGEVLFANPAMRVLLPELAQSRSIDDSLPAGHPVRQIVQQTLSTRHAQGPSTPSWGLSEDEGPIERLVVTSPIEDPERGFTGAMLVVRNLGYLDQVRSTLQYSHKLASLGRLMAGVAHEVKNPLNAMTIHLELLRNKLRQASGVGVQAASFADGRGLNPVMEEEHPAQKHVDVIATEITRLDHVMQDFLKFARPGEVKLEPIQAASLLEDIARVIGPDAERTHVTVRLDCAPHTPDINGDAGMLRQALMNLALNACQAMPTGGTLRLACRPLSSGRVEVVIEDTGQGIKPEHLDRIFDLYFTTKEKGSGIGLSMVYRIVQLHNGEIEVQSTPGAGTRFRILLPRA